MTPKSFLTVFAGITLLTGAYLIGSRNQAASAPHSSTSHSTRSNSSPGRDLREILNDPNPITFQKGYLNYLENLTAGEAREAAQILWSTPGELAELKERQKLFSYAWGALDGQASVKFVMANQSVAKITALSQAFAGWASKNPGSARDWIQNHLKPSEQFLYNGALVDGWSRHDPAAAYDYVVSLKNLPGTDRFVRSIALEQVRRSPSDAAQWATDLPEGSLKNTATEEVALRWSQVDPASASEWSLTVSNPGAMKRAVSTAVTQWSRLDSDGAGNYLEETPASPARDQAIAAHLRVLANNELEITSTWAKQINDTALREESLLQIANEWSGRDSEAVLAWLPRSGLPEKEITALSNKFAQR